MPAQGQRRRGPVLLLVVLGAAADLWWTVARRGRCAEDSRRFAKARGFGDVAARPRKKRQPEVIDATVIDATVLEPSSKVTSNQNGVASPRARPKRRRPNKEDIHDFGGQTAEGLIRAADLAEAARGGDVEAHFQLGVMFCTANGVKRDEAEAVRHMRQAAELGHAKAQNCLASFIRNGVGDLDIDSEEACSWYEKAAEQGDPEALYNLGDMHEKAEGVKHDVVKAFNYFDQAAKIGLSEAQCKAGFMLLDGIGVERDAERGLSLLDHAAGQGHAEALRMLGDLHSRGQYVGQDKVVAAEYFRKAAEAGSPLAQYCLGVMLADGDGVETDRRESRRWLKKAAAKGIVEAAKRCEE